MCRASKACATAFLSLVVFFAFTPAARALTGNTVDTQDCHALVVGVEHYDHWPARTNALLDAWQVAGELRRLGFSARLLPDPDAAKLHSALREFAQLPGRQSQCGLVIYYAGNSQIRATTGGKKTGWIIPRDAPLPAQDQQGFEEKAISSEQILALADQIQSRQILFLIDAPFPADDFQVETPALRVIRDEDALPACQFITSGADESVDLVRNDFLKYLLLGLRGEADLIYDGAVSASELGVYLQDRAANAAGRHWHPRFGRVPVTAQNSGDFIFRITSQTKMLARMLVDALPFSNTMGMQFQPIREGSFMMGSPPNEPGRLNDETLHRVDLTRPFYIQDTEVTTGQFKRFVQSTAYATEAEKGGGCWIADNGAGWKQKPDTSWKNPGSINTGDELPVVCVTWNDAKAFARWLSRKEGRTYRLPTEAEWEYAVRAGTSTPFSTGRCLSAAEASYDRPGSHYPNCATDFKHQRGHLVKAGMLAPNPWKLHNTHGNVSEWCLDWYGPYSSEPINDPQGPASGSERVMRGGHWQADAAGCRCARRWRFPPNLATDAIGFRLVVAP